MGYIGSDPKNNESVSTSQLVDDSVTNAKIVDNVLFTSVTSSIVSASGNITADTFTGTFNGALSSSAQIATSISGSSTSLSSSLSTRATTLESASGSFASDLVTLKGSGTAQGVGTSDSPTFADATITGTLTAQEVHTEFESASILFTSGSTQFGNSLDDNHVFSGSLLVTGSLVQLRGDSTKLRFSNDAGAERAFLQLNGTGLNIDTDSFIDFKPNNTFAARFDSNGRLGIGTNNPTVALEVFGSADQQIRIDSTGNRAQLQFDGKKTSDAEFAEINFANDGDSAAAIHAMRDGANDAARLAFFTQPTGGSVTERMSIDSSGFVGIGETSPSATLHIKNTGGTSYGQFVTIEGDTSDNNNYPGIVYKGGTLTDNYPNIGLTNGGLAISISGGYHSSNYNNRTNILLQGSDGSIQFATGTGGSSTERMRIESGGNVGIGTNNPGVQLDIYNTDHAILRLLAGTNKSASMRLRNDAQDWDVNCQTTDNFAIYDQTGGAAALTIAPSTYAATFGGDVTISKSNAKLTTFDSTVGNKESIVIDRNTANGDDYQEIRWKLQGSSYPGGYIRHDYEDTNNSNLYFGVRDSGTPGTALTIDNSKNATFASMVKASFFRSDNSTTSVANNTTTNISGLTGISGGLYIIHVYRPDYNPNDWAAHGIIRATGHSNIHGTFTNSTNFVLSVSGNNVQLTHQLGSTHTITASWIRVA